MARFSSGETRFVSAKFRRAWVRSLGLKATHSLMRLCSLACSAGVMAPKFREMASHFRFWASSMLFQLEASGLRACCCGGLNSFHALTGVTVDVAAGVKARGTEADAALRAMLAGLAALLRGAGTACGAAIGGWIGVWGCAATAAGDGLSETACAQLADMAQVRTTKPTKGRGKRANSIFIRRCRGVLTRAQSGCWRISSTE